MQTWLYANLPGRTRSCETMLRDQMSCRQRSNGQYLCNQNSLLRKRKTRIKSQS